MLHIFPRKTRQIGTFCLRFRSFDEKIVPSAMKWKHKIGLCAGPTWARSTFIREKFFERSTSTWHFSFASSGALNGRCQALGASRHTSSGASSTERRWRRGCRCLGCSTCLGLFSAETGLNSAWHQSSWIGSRYRSCWSCCCNSWVSQTLFLREDESEIFLNIWSLIELR